MRGRKDFNKPPFSNILPPCKVCGEPGTGFHYGVTTCGACKGFFRRSLVRPEPYECIQSRFCFVGPQTDRRMSCPRCRLDKCLAVGMSREACKVGRYTLTKKSEDIAEVMKQYKTPRPFGQPPVGYRNEWQPGYHPSTPGMSSYHESSYQAPTSQLFPSCSTNINYPSQSGSSVIPAHHQHASDRVEYNYSQSSQNTSSASSGQMSARITTNYNSHVTDDNQHLMDLTHSVSDIPSHGPQHQTTSGISITNQTSFPNTKVSSNLQCSSSNNDSSNQTILTVFDTPDSKPPRRTLGVNDKPNDVKAETTFTRAAEADSTIQPTPQNSKALVPVLDSKGDNETHPVIICLVEPDPMKYVVSIFDKFPFKCMERENLAPLLKLCYNTNYWLDEYLPASDIPTTERTFLETTKAPQEIDENAASATRVKIALSFEPDTELPKSAQDLTYDAEEMENLLGHIKRSHCRYWGPESAFLSRSERKMYMNMFHKMCQLQDSLQGSLNLIDDDKYYAILEGTGIDVDKRRKLFSYAFANVDNFVIKDSKFYLALPGFQGLPLCDRVSLTKATTALQIGLRHSDSSDIEKDVCVDESRGIATRFSTLLQIMGGFKEMSQSWFDLMNYVKQLELSFDEHLLLKVLMNILPEYCDDLQEADLVKKLHISYLKCLLHLVRQTHKDKGDDRFNKILAILQKLIGMRDGIFEAREASRETYRKLNDETKQPILTEIFVN